MKFSEEVVPVRRRAHMYVGLTVVLLVFGGCYHYVPLSEADPAVAEGTPVRVHLDPPRSFDVSGYTAHDVGRVEGSLVERTSDSWILSARSLHATSGNSFQAGSWALTIPATSVATAEARTVSWWRTATATVASLFGIYVLSEALQGTSRTGTDGSDGGEVRAVVPAP
ncbi:MAG: hypothetical protein U5R14_12445 [Gemmatimonadota bacterium]|nr:hypothetical protein [Gemmatimonadota bacterium]